MILPRFSPLFRTVTLRRRSGIWADGRWVEVAPTDVTLVAHVQPARPSDMESLPEGRRAGSAVRIYAVEPILGVVEGGTQLPDVLLHDGAEWEVQSVERWGALGHHKAIAVRRDRGGALA